MCLQIQKYRWLKVVFKYKNDLTCKVNIYVLIIVFLLCSEGKSTSLKISVSLIMFYFSLISNFLEEILNCKNSVKNVP